MHHAILLIGERDEVEAHLDKLFNGLNVKTVGNPDVFVYELESFGVDEAREVGEHSVTKAFGSKKFFILRAQKFTAEAQNALLKTFEDPTPNTHFVLTARDTGIFLPTLISRMEVVRVGGELEENEAKKFLKKSLKSRLEYAKKFDGALVDLLDSLLLELKKGGSTLTQLKEVLDMRSYARDTAALPRLILEHLALVL